MISDARIREIYESQEPVSGEEIADLTSELLRRRHTDAFVHEQLKAIYINAKETEERNIVVDIVADIARTCMKRLKAVRRTKGLPGPLV